MTTSGTTSFTMDAAKIIDKAFSKIGVKIAEQDLEAFEFDDGIDALNMMVKSWAAQGLHLWAKDEGVLFLDAGKTNYDLGPTGDKACLSDAFISTTTTADQSTSSVFIQLASTSGMAQFDNIGIELDDNTRHWTTIFSVHSATQITVNNGLPSPSKAGSTAFKKNIRAR